MPLPNIPCGDVFYKRQIWVYNFCIYSGKTGKSYHYMYDESTGKIGQNDVISFIDHFLKNILAPGVKHILCILAPDPSIITSFLFFEHNASTLSPNDNQNIH